jgi:hypothetical protein
MKSIMAFAALLLVTSTALPASAAMPISNGNVAAAPVETVQYRHQQTARQPSHQVPATRYHNGYGAYASHNGSPTSTTGPSRDVIPGWPCEFRDESSTYSAFPAWEICN